MEGRGWRVCSAVTDSPALTEIKEIYYAEFSKLSRSGTDHPLNRALHLLGCRAWRMMCLAMQVEAETGEKIARLEQRIASFVEKADDAAQDVRFEDGKNEA